MKRIIISTGITLFIVGLVLGSVAGNAAAAGYGYMEPAPESGDCIPNGSGFDGDVGGGTGPAPNAGDGIPDGSGF